MTILYEIYRYHGKDEMEPFRTEDFGEFLKELTRISRLKDPGEVFVSSKESRHKGK